MAFVSCMFQESVSGDGMVTSQRKLSQRSEKASAEKPATDRACPGAPDAVTEQDRAGLVNLTRTAARAVLHILEERARIRKTGSCSWMVFLTRSWVSMLPSTRWMYVFLT